MTPLRQRMIEDMRIRKFTEQTQTSYCQYVSQFARHFHRSPEHLGPEDIRAYQHYLVHEKKLSASSLFVAVGALRFLYKVTLKTDWPIATIIPTPKRQTKLPMEVVHIYRIDYSVAAPLAHRRRNLLKRLVGMTGFEPATP